jgi:hypothetical protein
MAVSAAHVFLLFFEEWGSCVRTGLLFFSHHAMTQEERNFAIGFLGWRFRAGTQVAKGGRL